MTDREKIQGSINSIEPREGAKECMLANIREKAAANSRSAPAAKKSSPLIKIMKWSMPIAACLVIGVAAFNVIPRDPAPPVESGCPFLPVSSAEEFEKRLGIKIDAPEGASDVDYTIIDGSLANINFTYNGAAYMLRASKQGEDFSGIHGVEAASEQLDSETSAILTTIKSGDLTFLKVTWTDGSVNYVLSDTESGDAEKIKTVFDLIK